MIDRIRHWFDHLLDEKNYTLEAIIGLVIFIITPPGAFLPLVVALYAYVWVKHEKKTKAFMKKRLGAEDDL